MPSILKGDSPATVADLLAFDALDDDTRYMAERVMRHRLASEFGDEWYDEDDMDAAKDRAEEKGYRRGLADGKAIAEEELKGKPATGTEG